MTVKGRDPYCQPPPATMLINSRPSDRLYWSSDKRGCNQSFLFVFFLNFWGITDPVVIYVTPYQLRISSSHAYKSVVEWIGLKRPALTSIRCFFFFFYQPPPAVTVYDKGPSGTSVLRWILHLFSATLKSSASHHSLSLISFYLPLAVDESLGHISISFKLLTVQPWLQARGVSAPFPCVCLM